MIDPASALAFLALSLVVIVVPGPGVLFAVVTNVGAAVLV